MGDAQKLKKMTLVVAIVISLVAIVISVVMCATPTPAPAPVFRYSANRKVVSREFGHVSKIIHQTWDTIESIPPCCEPVITNNLFLNPDWNYKFYSRDDRRRVIAEHFDARILAAFDKLPTSTASADLFRNCVLFVYGGAYFDIKSACGRLTRTLEHAAGRLVYFKWPYGLGPNDHPHHAATFLFWPAGHWVLKRVIDEIVRRIHISSPQQINNFITLVTGPNVYSAVVCAHVPFEYMLYTDDYFENSFQHDGTGGEYYTYMKSRNMHWSQQKS